MRRFISALLIGLGIASCAGEKESRLPAETNFCDDIHRNDSLSLSGELAPLAERMKDETAVRVLEDGAGSMVARAWLSEYAEKSIDIQYFIFSLDNVGLIACDYLVRAADRGVKVRIIVDDIMVDTDIENVLTLDAHENIDIRIYNPGVNLGKNIFSKVKKLATEFRSANQRMHNKTFLIDGKVAITGGRNIADEYFDYDHEYNFRDRDVLLLGKEVQKMDSSFDEFWNYDLCVPVKHLSDFVPPEAKTNNIYARLHEYACNPENFAPQIRTRLENLPNKFRSLYNSGQIIWTDSIQFVSDEPGKNDGTQGLGGGGISTDALTDLVQNAKHSIAIQSPYLISTAQSQALFKAAVDRGVEVRIMTNSMGSTDNSEAFAAYQSSREDLLKTGVRIFEFKPDAASRARLMTSEFYNDEVHKPIFGLHAKSMVVDGETTVIGTFNLDPRSANLNTECVTIIHSKKVAEGVLSEMEEEFKPENSWETTLEFNPDSEFNLKRRVKTWTRKALPKDIL